MPQYNYFGCEYTDIVNAFKGAVANDFGGQSIIEAEMELAEAELIGQMSPKALQMLQTVEYQEVPQIASISGSMQYTLNPALLQDLYVYEVDRYNPALNNAISSPIPGICSEQSGCSNIKKQLDSSYLFTDYTVTGSTITFGSSFDQDTHTYYVSYTADTSTLDLPSLKGMIRDRVACVLGMQLYSRQDDTWSLVDLYCTRADKWMAMIDEHWLPSEYKKNKYLNSPFTVKGSITTIKIGRS
jgi:hypothetical protein